ncbi:Cof-type HAD-IIB family hydrolase [Priestia koreensis]|uniref:Cof-type HAD-IIB family hydrolase n=1 Tax=Priestia koreensis TaxID=284581 RepID=UPI001F561824|nr:Cof-type HAD-IIB family hydrolase [Priestia koreensis]MCM3004739.1 Cof-type HAD-IIB family hydrolase [Priestia koreensis]UNL85543.1 HAD family phosphatase [Priestia koreensis]
MTYRLLALNIDGTILNSQGRLTKETKEAISYVKEKGVDVTLVTNRHFLSAKKFAKALKLPSSSLLVTHSGAFIGSSVDKPFVNKRISEDTTYAIVQMLEHFDCHIRIMHERFSIGNRVKLPNQLTSKNVLRSGEPLFYPLQFVDSLENTLYNEPVSTPKIEVFFANRREMERAEATVASAVKSVDWFSYPHEHRCYITTKGACKATGLRAVAQQLGIPMEDVVVIGNCHDDVEMVEQAGMGVAMGHAPNELKRVAKWITRSNNENGVAYMVKELFRKQHRIGYLYDLKTIK